MSETTAPNARAAAHLQDASRAAAAFDRQSAQMFRRMAAQQQHWQKGAERLARQMLRSLGLAESRSRRVSDEMDRLARRAAVFAARQWFSGARGASLAGGAASAQQAWRARSERQSTAAWARLVSSGLRAL